MPASSGGWRRRGVFPLSREGEGWGEGGRATAAQPPTAAKERMPATSGRGRRRGVFPLSREGEGWGEGGRATAAQPPTVDYKDYLD